MIECVFSRRKTIYIDHSEFVSTGELRFYNILLLYVFSLVLTEAPGQLTSCLLPEKSPLGTTVKSALKLRLYCVY